MEENLRQLGRDHLDLAYYRTPGPGPVAEHVGALAELVDAGLVRHLGVSNVTPEQLAEARGVTTVVAVQNRHGVGSRHEGAEDLWRTCGEHGIAFVPFFAIAGEPGAPAEEPEAVTSIAATYGVSTAQVRLAWTLGLGDHVLAIPGTGSLDHLDDNLAAASLRLTEDEMARLASL